MFIRKSNDKFGDINFNENEQIELEKGDFTAMTVAAFMIMIPTMLVIFGVFAAAIFMMFGTN